MNYIGALAIEGKTFNYRTTSGCTKALELSCSRPEGLDQAQEPVAAWWTRTTQEKIDIARTG